MGQDASAAPAASLALRLHSLLKKWGAACCSFFCLTDTVVSITFLEMGSSVLRLRLFHCHTRFAPCPGDGGRRTAFPVASLSLWLRPYSWRWVAACCSSCCFTGTVASPLAVEMGDDVLHLLLVHYHCGFAPLSWRLGAAYCNSCCCTCTVASLPVLRD